MNRRLILIIAALPVGAVLLMGCKTPPHHSPPRPGAYPPVVSMTAKSSPAQHRSTSPSSNHARPVPTPTKPCPTPTSVQSSKPAKTVAAAATSPVSAPAALPVVAVAAVATPIPSGGTGTGIQIAQPVAQGLANTGNATGQELVIGGLLAGLGTGLTWLGRRKTS